MQFAIDSNDKRVHINDTHSNQEYYCEDCGARLIVRKGDIRIHHFAHPAHHQCTDSWVTDRERKYDTSDWHNEWQSSYPASNQEVRLSLGDIKHRADVMIGKTVIEFQHSIMSANAFDDRNNFYMNLGYKVIWLFDMQELYNAGYLDFLEKDSELLFRWRNPKKAFNAYDIKSGCIDLFFQILDDESACIVMVKDVSEHGFESFTTTRVQSRTEFLNYTGLLNGCCLPPDKDEFAINENYLAFKSQYGISLNKQQERALQSVEGASLLLAVPGSGKTTVLVDRIGFMVLVKEIQPQTILAITYTKNAAIEMQQRCIEKFGCRVGNMVSFSTINALSLRIYKQFRSKFSKVERRHIGETDQNRLIRDIFKKYGNTHATQRDIIGLRTTFAYIKNMMLSDEEIEEFHSGLFELGQMYQDYQAILKERKLMDLDDQMVFAHWILSNDKEALNELRNQYKYVCVDEAQDTSKIQHAIIKLLVGSNNLFMVGDEDQSIYGFRAAYPKALLNFRYDYKNPYILRMEHNYRSTPQIVEKAQGFISKNRGRYEKKMTAERGDGQRVQLKAVKTRKEQYQYLVEIATGRKCETAFLYRDNDSAVVLADLLLRNDVPFQLKKPEANFFKAGVIKTIIAYLKFALDDRNVEAFRQICNKGILYIRSTQQDWAIRKVKKNNISIYDAVDDQMKYINSAHRNRGGIFRSKLSGISHFTASDAISQILAAGYEQYVKSENLDYDKIEILRILAEQESSIANFLERLAYLKARFAKGFHAQSDNPIILSTIHSSKGLEYDSVYMVDVYDGRFPSAKEDAFKRSKDSAGAGQEERRLFYVGITRAKNQLTLVSIEHSPSSFIDELFPNKSHSVHLVTAARETSILPQRPSLTMEQLRHRQWEEEAKRKQKAEEEKRQRDEDQRALDEQCYTEICDKFAQQEFQIRDHTGRRWVKCELCGTIKVATEFSSYGGENHMNLGTCKDCSRANLV